MAIPVRMTAVVGVVPSRPARRSWRACRRVGPSPDGVHSPDDPTDKSCGTFTKLNETSYSHAQTRDTDHDLEEISEKI
jgi:hypothetical protein